MNRKYLISGIILTLIVFIIIEIINPFAFTQDDNASQFLPVILEGSSQMFSGHLPAINLHQLMGTEIMENGIYSIFYPPMILSYFISTYILGNSLFTLEIFVLIHLILGFIFSFFLFFEKTKDPKLASLASLAFIFSGYIIQLSGTWYYVAPSIVFLPLIFYFYEKFEDKFVWRGILRGAFFYSGNAQYFVFLCLFELIYLLLQGYQQGKDAFFNSFKKYLNSLIITLIVIMPLLFSQLTLIQNSFRGDLSFLAFVSSGSVLITDYLFGSLFVQNISSLLVDSSIFRFSQLHYVGTFFSLIFLMGGVYSIKKFKKGFFKKVHPSFLCGLISILLSFGIFGGIYLIFTFLPIVKNFLGPYKLILFSNFFIIFFASIFFSKLKEDLRLKKNFLNFMYLLSLVLILTGAFFSIGGNTYSGDSIPLEREYFDDLNLQGFRAISVGTNSSVFLGGSPSKNVPEWLYLNKNYASYFNLDHISGYEEFKDKLTYEKISVPRGGIFSGKLNLTTLKEYGIKYVFIPENSLGSHPELNALQEIHKTNEFRILELPNPKGYIFTEKENLNYTRNVNGIQLKKEFNEDTLLTINFLYKKNYILKINGKRENLSKDKYGRMTFFIQKGEKEVKLKYVPWNFYKGILISLILLIIFLMGKKAKLGEKMTFPKEKFLKYLRKLKKISRKYILFILLLFIVIFIVLIFNKLFSSNEIESFVEIRTGLDLEIGDVKFHPFSGRLILEEFSLKKENSSIFFSKKINLDIDYGETLKEILHKKKVKVKLKKLTLESIVIKGEINDQETECEKNLLLEVSSKLIDRELLIEKDILELRKITFSNNEIFLEIDETFYFDNSSIRIKSKLNFREILEGELFILKEADVTKKLKKCIYFPLADKNLFTS